MGSIRSIIRRLKKQFKIIILNEKWQNKNIENYTKLNSIIPIDKVSVGKMTYGTLNVHYYNQKEEFLEIGSFCSIADNVHFFTGGNHRYDCIMTYPFKNIFSKNAIQESITKGKIIVGDDVWIGYGSTILSGVTIGKGAIIGANSIVTKDIPPYAIYAGNRIIKYRFSEGIIKKLVNVDFSNIDVEKLQKKIEVLYEEITEKNIDKIIKEILN